MNRTRPFSHFTMGQNRKKHRINSHLIIHFPTSEGVSERAKRVVRSQRMSERRERTSKWPSTPFCILGYSGPQCGGEGKRAGKSVGKGAGKHLGIAGSGATDVKLTQMASRQTTGKYGLHVTKKMRHRAIRPSRHQAVTPSGCYAIGLSQHQAIMTLRHFFIQQPCNQGIKPPACKPPRNQDTSPLSHSSIWSP